MWKQVAEGAKQIVALVQDSQKNKTDIKALQEGLREARQETKEVRQEIHLIR